MRPNRAITPYLSVLLLAMLAPSAYGQERPCTAPEYRQFDFWIGEWAVFQDEQRVGTNRISRTAGSCALLEQWESVRGTLGTSINFYDPQSGEWNQLWVGEGGGLILRMHGAFADGQMMLGTDRTRETPDGDVYDRIRWYQDGKDVMQIWEVSPDRQDWEPIFRGTYRRVEAAGGS